MILIGTDVKAHPLVQLRVQTINIEFSLTGVPIRFVKFAPLRKLRSSEAGQPPIYYLFESESVLLIFDS
jgi:hypothetical protein